MRLGTSQKTVLDHLKAQGPLTDDQIGAALYDTTSSCANPSSTNKHRRDWSRRVLKGLVKLGTVRLLANGDSDGRPAYEAIRIDESLGLPHDRVEAIATEVKHMLHAHRDGLRSRNQDTMKTRFDCREGFYGEAFGIMRALATLGHGTLDQADNTPEVKSNLKWWFRQLEDEVLREENYPGAGGDDSGRCDFCLERWGKDGAGRRRSS